MKAIRGGRPGAGINVSGGVGGSGLTPDQLLEEASKLLIKDRARLGNSNFPVYQGRTSTPMSSLTQKARGLREQSIAQGAPYSQQLRSVLGRNNEGFAPNALNAQMQQTENAQQNFGAGKLLPILQGKYQQSYAPFAGELQGNLAKDLRLGLGEHGERLGEIGAAAGNLEKSRNEQLAKALQALQGRQEGRREGLVRGLEQYGNQKHAYGNLSNEIGKRTFEQERDAPLKRINALEQALNPLRGSLDDSVHPDFRNLKAQEAIKALRAYGIDPSLPPSEWESKRTPPPSYKGKLLANLPPEILASHDTLEKLDPNYQDEYSVARNNLTQDLIGDQNVASRVLSQVPRNVQGRVAALENDAEETLQKDLMRINNEYSKTGGYGSTAHLKQVNERARTLNKAVQEQRQKLIEDALKSNLSTEHGKQIGDIGKLDLYGKQGQKEFADILGLINQTNQLGATKFRNEQEDLEDQYKNFQNEALWQLPHLRQTARGEAQGDIFQGLQSRGIGLEDLANMKARYSELEKERGNYENQLAGNQSQLNNYMHTINNLQQELSTTRNREAQERAAQAAAQAQAYAQQQGQAQAAMQAQQQAQAQAAAQEQARLQALPWSSSYQFSTDPSMAAIEQQGIRAGINSADKMQQYLSLGTRAANSAKSSALASQIGNLKNRQQATQSRMNAGDPNFRNGYDTIKALQQEIDALNQQKNTSYWPAPSAPIFNEIFARK